ncbi:MAG TPA: pitrilysin family protein [Anaerolineae bacterium]
MNLEFARYSLSNGITLIVKENHHAQSVVIRGYLRGGANLDPPERIGRAAFTADVMRRGTKKRTFNEINETIEAVAASVYVNAGRHLLGFGGKSLAVDFEFLVELMTDNILGPVFPAKEVEKLRGQIITDLKELEDDPGGLARRYFREILYPPGHPYSRPVEGTFKSIPHLSRADLLDFYQVLHPHGGIVVVVGDVTGEFVYQTLEATLGQWAPTHPPPDTAVPLPAPLSEPIRSLHKMDNKSQTDLVLGHIGPQRVAADFYATYVGNTILGQLGLGGRIGHSVRDNQGLAYYAGTSMLSGLGPGPWFVYAGVNPVAVDRAIELILTEIRRFNQELVTDQELVDAKAYLTGILPLQMESNEGIAATLMEMQIYQLGDDFITRYPDLIYAVTKEDIQAAARKYLSDTVYALSIAGPYHGTASGES